jgi:hypothetical protein
MAKYALIRNNIVLNTILAENDPEFLEHLRTFHRADLLIESETAGVDDIYNPENQTFTRPVVVAEDNNDANNA